LPASSVLSDSYPASTVCPQHIRATTPNAFLLPIAAISILTPNSQTTWYKNSTVQMTWSSAAGDPNPFRIFLGTPDANATLADSGTSSMILRPTHTADSFSDGMNSKHRPSSPHDPPPATRRRKRLPPLLCKHDKHHPSLRLFSAICDCGR
jgi:hypothetical protein